MPRRGNIPFAKTSTRVSSQLRDAIHKHIPDDEWVDLVNSIPRVVFGVDAAHDSDYTVVFGTVDGIVFENLAVIKPNPPMRNVTPPKPKLLKESNE